MIGECEYLETPQYATFVAVDIVVAAVLLYRILEIRSASCTGLSPQGVHTPPTPVFLRKVTPSDRLARACIRSIWRPDFVRLSENGPHRAQQGHHNRSCYEYQNERAFDDYKLRFRFAYSQTLPCP